MAIYSISSAFCNEKVRTHIRTNYCFQIKEGNTIAVEYIANNLGDNTICDIESTKTVGNIVVIESHDNFKINEFEDEEPAEIIEKR
jgi:hypothetical protein